MEFSTTFSTLLTKIRSLLNADLHYFSRPGFHQAIVMPFDAKGLFFPIYMALENFEHSNSGLPDK